MGRRSINTTKSGKYMNPTDQARKEARKLELKKNKKQRQMVRAAVLKGKDPQQILEEMEKIDQMEYNVNQPSPLNEKVLKDKRKKLRDTLERVLSMYSKDEPEKWAELKRRQTEYEHKRNQLVAFYESVKTAQHVTVDEIPLPAIPQQIPMPTEQPVKKPEHTIYSIATALKLQALGQPIREPPGCPPGPPPELDSDGELIEEHSEETNSEEIESKKPTGLQQKMVALSGQNVDEFMKEMEKKMEQEDQQQRAKPMPFIEPPAPPGMEPVALKPPALLLPAPMRIPPGPPPGRPPLMPPGPPPGLPPPRLPPPIRLQPPRMLRMPAVTPNVLSAGPQLIAPLKQSATISAKPQIRNLSADVTRFVPSTLRVKREDKKPKQSKVSLAQELKQKELRTTPQPTKDDAYMQFMKEMQQLL